MLKRATRTNTVNSSSNRTEVVPMKNLLLALFCIPFLLLFFSAYKTSILYSSPQVNAAPSDEDMSITGSPTLSVDFINQVLAFHQSPAMGTGEVFYDLSVAHQIDDAFALAFFAHESGYGHKGVASHSRSVGNLRCIADYPCYGGFAYFPSWEEGIKAWYRLLDSDLYVKSGRTTLKTI